MLTLQPTHRLAVPPALAQLHLFARTSSDPWRPLHACQLRDAAGRAIYGEAYAARGSMLWVLAAGWAYGIDVNAIQIP